MSEQHHPPRWSPDIDIIALSEHWLHNYNLKSIFDLDMNLKFGAMASPEIEDKLWIEHAYQGFIRNTRGNIH